MCELVGLTPWVLLSLPLLLVQSFDNSADEPLGPIFISEPPSRVDFLNTTGASISCLAYGNPAPRIAWRLRDGSRANDVAGLRQTLANGTLVLWPMRPEQYRQDIHAAVYTCEAANVMGTILSREVHVRGVVKQYYEVQVYDEFVLRGNTAVIKCHIPSFVKDYVSVVSWIRDDVVTITSTVLEGGRYSVFLSGELHIRNATQSDGSPSYLCQTTHRLTHELRVSATAGRLIVTDSSGSVPPRVTDSRAGMTTVVGDTVELPCAAQGYPMPRYSWYRYVGRNNSQLTAVYLDPRMSQLSGSLIIRQVSIEDGGKYVCIVSNAAGEQRTEMLLTITAPLSAHVQPQKQVVDVSKSATFNCSFSGHPVHSISWVKDGRPVVLDGVRIKLLSSVILYLSSVQREDAGMYQCFVANDHDSAQGTAQLLLGDAVPVFHYVFPEDPPLQPGPFHSFKCVASGNPLPQITWTLDGSLLPENERFRVGDYITIQGHVVSYVNITSVRVEDGGVYECRATSSVGSISHAARLNVYGLPFIRPMKEISAVAGEKLVLRCHVAGYPIDTITWSRGGSRLPINRRQEVFPNGTLVIHNIQRRVDDGSYTCRAWNKQGQSASGSVRVHVMVRPVIDPFSFPKSLQEGMRARLVCTVIEGDPPFSIRWHKDGRAIEPGLGVIIRNDDFSSDLAFTSVSPRHNGNYTCTASNAAAAVSHSAILVVDVPPRWRVEPRDASVVAGDNIRIDCLADGYPAPVITWERGSAGTPRYYTVIASGPHYEVYANGSLLVKNAQEEDGGYYLCQATNNIGSGLSKVIFLTVHVPPRFDTKFRSETARKGDLVRLRCEATGDHPMTIVWNVDKQPLNPADDNRYELEEDVSNKRMSSEITIRSAERRDSALFTCLVTNSFGRDDMNVRLIVQEPPESPREVRVLEQQSRMARITWSLPFSGNSAIIRYLVQCISESGDWDKNVQNYSVPSEETSITIRGLRPAEVYQCRVRAQNAVGMGDPSEPVVITTSEEVPGGPPLDVKAEALDSQSVRVSWKPPERELWNGPIKGYYVGYKVHDSDDPYLYKTLEVGEGTREEVLLTQLQKFTRYSVLVQAYNAMGAGPRSDEVVVRTMEDVPSHAPENVKCSPLTSQSLHVAWDAPPMSSIHGVLQGYKLLYKPVTILQDEQEHEEKTVTGTETKLSGLQKFTNYSITVVAFTKRGPGVRSEPVYCRTLEDIPGPPADIKAAVVSSDTILVSWRPPLQANGLVTKYSIHWRSLENGAKNATTVRVSPTQLQYKVSGLKENSRHEFWVSATTSRGEGHSTRVVSQTTTKRAPARIVDFGHVVVTVPGEKISLPCQAVGYPPLERVWRVRGEPVSKTERMDTFADGSLTIRKLQVSDEGNYSCHVHNKHGADEITYTLSVREPVSSHGLQVKVLSTTATSAQLSFSKGGIGRGMTLGYEVHFRSEGGDWEKRRLLGRNQTFTLDGLQCGTRYQLYAMALTSEGKGPRSDPIAFRTQGTAPIAPKKEETLHANFTHLVVFLSAWQNGGCSINRMVIEYRSHTNAHWTLLTNRVTPEQQSQLVVPDLTPETWYAVRITAYTSAGSTMEEYDVITLSSSGAAPGSDPGNQGHIPSPSFFEDTTTLVSMASSGVVLIAGIVAVVCLIMYKRHRNTRHHYRAESSSSRSDVATTTALMAHLEKKSQRSESTSRPSFSHSHSQSQSQSRSDRDVPAYFTSPVRKVAPSNNAPAARPLNNSPSTSHCKYKGTGKADYEEEITPYATFRLPGTQEGEEDANPTEEFKTFSVRHGEPPYMMKSSLDPPSSKSGKASEEFYQSQGAPNSHSLTSGSSNQEELMRAYEYARRHPPPPLQYEGSHNRGQSHTSGTTESEGTDPGIRQFSGSPPKPNERRQGACLTPGVPSGTTGHTNDSSTSDEATPVNSPPQARSLAVGFSALARDRSRPSWGGGKGRSQSGGSKRTSSKGIKKGLSSDESDSDGTIYTFSGRAETVVPRGSSGYELSETECDRDRMARLSRGPFPRKPPLRTQNKSDVIDC